jgi:O-antigen/teichoic acid export membrane protein
MTIAAANQEHRGQRFLRNVLWNWLGTAVSLFIGFVLSPYLILKLGADGYGVWAITFSLVEYYWFFDLGFRSATVKFVAHYSAISDSAGVRSIISTSLVFSSIASSTVFAAVGLTVGHVDRFFQIPRALRGNFETLLILITLNWCLGLVFNVFNACLEAVQHFEYSNKASIISAAIRAIGWTLALYFGYKLIAIGIVTVASQAVGYAFNYAFFRKVFPSQRLSLRHASFATLREMARYGIHTFVMTISNQLLNQGAPILIGHYLAAAFVGFYNLPVRLLQYTVELVGRIGIITNTNAAELAARRRPRDLAALAVWTNRYCLVLFMPLAIVLWTHGRQLLTFWVGESFASRSAAVLPILTVGYVIGIVGQFSAGMLLQGLGKHQRYARTLLLEAIVALPLLAIAIPRWGILGAAGVSASLMIVNRGLVASWLVAQTVAIPFASYVRRVYGGPLIAMLPVLALSLWLRSVVFPGESLVKIAAAALIVALAYYALAFRLLVERDHRALLYAWIAGRWKPAAARAAMAN